MIIKEEPYLIEYNVRMGDPECQTILPILKSDIVDVFTSCVTENLNNLNLLWTNKKSICVVLCSNGYPNKYEKNVEIKNFDKLNLNENNFLFHAGTFKNEDKILANGGRVLNFVSLSDSFEKARNDIHQNINKLKWDKGFYRRDIAFKVIS